MLNREKDLRDRLNKILVMELKSFVQLQEEIGIHRDIVSDFMNGRGSRQLKILLKIERYVLNKEKELGL